MHAGMERTINAYCAPTTSYLRSKHALNSHAMEDDGIELTSGYNSDGWNVALSHLTATVGIAGYISQDQQIAPGSRTRYGLQLLANVVGIEVSDNVQIRGTLFGGLSYSSAGMDSPVAPYWTGENSARCSSYAVE